MVRALAICSVVVGLALGLSLGACQKRTSTSARAPGASPTTTPRSVSTKSCTSRRGLPDATCTPGATNPSVTQATIATTVCKRGWTATIRPPLSYTENLKRKGIRAYGYADRALGHYEEDHLIPLELGGSPTDPSNLWPESHAPLALGSRAKDRVENVLNHEVCRGGLPLATAQHEIATNWETAK